MSHYEIEILVLEDEVRLGQLLCNMIQLHRIGTPHLSTSEIDACQMMEIQRFDLCIFDLSVRGKICHRAVDAANAKSIPTLLLSENNDDSELNLRPARGLRVQKPATEEDIHRAVMELLPPEGGRQGQAI
ncbi:MAG: hypothetical protein BM562_03580 [Alphaproteobacteria bacterium MedPE-SWcel]|nr:MAG: hypothetical protein BM562_03580 [Alphaproteobacteria bacterium MedPE-SWcel]